MNEIAGHPGWFYSTLEERDEGVETEIYFETERHYYPGILIWAENGKELFRKALAAIKEAEEKGAHNMFPTLKERSFGRTRA